MESDALLAVARDGLMLLVWLAAPTIGAAAAAGLAIAIVQAATQVHEQTVPFAVKAAAALAGLIAAGPWIGARLVAFTASTLELARTVGTP
ncbi:MAG: flagellar biosynthetic protein FliQ [Myxococcales bacterium]|nr:flagellar biosynthetic protein FliQ [Myxococcales bacterium]MCB9519927.1 flagellar biosynthetic protein FliQ [Myxococcales bacterium]MCB9533165.1 flagellar biosynthetic protein FliQ [Myxococcales bacterium]